MTDRHKGPVIADLVADAVGIDAGHVRDVVAVGLKPADHRIFGIEQVVALAGGSGGIAAVDEWPVVTDLVGAARWRAGVQAVAAIGVVSLPSRIGCLKYR